MTFETWRLRLWTWVRNLFRTHERQLTALESSQEQEIKHLNSRVSELEEDLHSYKTKNRELESQIKIDEREIAGLIAVISRNQKRVEAETAVAAADIARITTGRNATNG